MKKSIIHSLIAIIAAGVLTGCINIYEGHKCHGEKCEKGEKGEAEHKEACQTKLMAEAKVSKDDAGKIALAKVPNGTINEAEIEKEHGKLVWSFDITTPDTKDITEVNVDAITGDVVNVEKESAKDKDKDEAKNKD